MIRSSSPFTERYNSIGSTAGESVFEETLKLNDQRIRSVVAVLKNSGLKRLLDLGCGEGKILRALFETPAFEEIVGMDVSYRSLELAQDRLRLDSLLAQRRNCRRDEL